jgi:DNA polymerase-3 subunit delta
MQVASAQFANHLQAQASKGLRSLYTFHGDEPLLQQEALDALRTTARAQGYTERNVFAVAGAHFDWGEVLAAGGSMSLFADKQLIEIRIPSGKPGKEGSTALQQIAELAVGNDSTLTVVLLPRLDKATKSSAWFSALENNGISVQIDPIERHALPPGLPNVWARSNNAWPLVKRANTPCSFLPNAWKVTCWLPTKKFKSSRSCIQKAS